MKLKYFDIELAVNFVSSQPRFTNEAFVSKNTGKYFFVAGYGDADELPEDIEDADKYITVPHKNDLDLGIELVREFVGHHIPDQTQEVARIFSRKGAYARFKEFLERLGLLEVWYCFEAARTEAALKRWCTEQGIDFEE